MQTYRLFYLKDEKRTVNYFPSPMSPNRNFGWNIVKRKNINNLRKDLITSGYIQKMSDHGVVVEKAEKSGEFVELGHLYFNTKLKKWVWDVETDDGYVESRHYVKSDGSISPKTTDGLIRVLRLRKK